MPLYESVFIVRQDVSVQHVEGLAERYSEMIKENGGEVAKTEYWGLKNLAYRVKKNRKGHYMMFNIDGPSAAIDEFERNMRLSEDVLRYMTIRVDELEEGPSAMMRNKGSRDEGRRDDRDRYRDRDRDRGGRDRANATGATSATATEATSATATEARAPPPLRRRAPPPLSATATEATSATATEATSATATEATSATATEATSATATEATSATATEATSASAPAAESAETPVEATAQAEKSTDKETTS